MDRKGDNVIYVVGDSHTAIFKNDPAFKVVEIAGTAHNLINEKSTSNSHQKLQQVIDSIDKKSDFIMLVFGETDCRFHIYYQAQKRHAPIYDIIDETVQWYGQALQWMRKQGVEPIVLGITPTGTYDRFEFDVPGKPYASPQMLSQIYKLFNHEMWIYCNKNSFMYLDIYLLAADEKGFLEKEFAADAVHLNEKALPLIKEMLKGRFL
jgi:lysophospholipase L1-like esterase